MNPGDCKFKGPLQGNGGFQSFLRSNLAAGPLCCELKEEEQREMGLFFDMDICVT